MKLNRVIATGTRDMSSHAAISRLVHALVYTIGAMTAARMTRGTCKVSIKLRASIENTLKVPLPQPSRPLKSRLANAISE